MKWIRIKPVRCRIPHDSRSGFSLLELSLVLVVLSLMLSGGLNLLTASTQQEQIRQSMDELDEIYDAMKEYVSEYGRLPCPASITLVSGNALYGRAATDCSDTSPPAGLTRVAGATSGFVRIGGVPFYTLGLPERYMADAYNNRYLYAVTEATITGITPGSTGNIRIVDNVGTAIISDAVLTIVSAGPSHRGSNIAKTGVLFSACNATNKDGENCDNDAIFTDATFNDGNVAANFFDDLILWIRVSRLF